MRRAKVLALSGLLTCATSVGAQEQPFEGAWGRLIEDCRNQTESDSLLVITGTKLQRYEQECKIERIIPREPGTWRMRLACEKEGDKSTLMSTISVLPDGRLRVKQVGGRSETFIRCDTRSKNS